MKAKFNKKEDNTNFALSINLTGIRLLQLFASLIESPKSFDEINQYFLENKYLKTKFSNDTLRNDLNALRAAGCKISRANKSNGYKYILKQHPFNLVCSNEIITALKKVYTCYLHLLSIEDIISLDILFKNLAKHCVDVNEKEALLGISILKGMDTNLIKDLVFHVKKQNQVNLLYHSNSKGDRSIDILCEKFSIRNKKLYLTGYDFLHNAYSNLLVKNIKKINTTKLQKSEDLNTTIIVTYELNNITEGNFVMDLEDKVIKVEENKIIVQTRANNEFFLIQKLLEYGSICKVLEPETIKEKIIKELRVIKEIYEKQ